jgi:tetratricopeptide (TPR) repeat protein
MINLHLDIDIRTLPEEEAKKKIDDINFVAGHFIEINHFDWSRFCAENALSMSEAIGYAMGIADANSNLGMISYGMNEHEEAIGRFLKASQIYSSLQEFSKEGDVYSYLGISYRYIDNYAEMIDVLFKALYIYRESGELSKEGNILNSIGNYYLEIRQEQLALEYYDMTLKMKRKQMQVDGCIRVLFNKGLIYYNLKDYGRAYKYYSEAQNFNEKIERNPLYKIRIMQNIASVYRETKKYEEAEKNYFDCIDYYDKNKNLIDKCDCMQALAALYSSMERREAALKLFGEAEALAKKLNSKRLLMLIYKGLTDYYLGLNDFKNALIFRRLDVELDFERNKTIEKENIRKLNVLHRVDITKKETEILTEKNEELKNLNNKLLRLNEEKNYFLGVVSNDLKAPLKKISDTVKNILSNSKDEKPMNLPVILDHSSQMQKIISNLLTVNETETTL